MFLNRRSSSRASVLLVALVATLALVAAACGGDESAEEPGAGNGNGATEQEKVTVYLGRHYGIEPVFEEFTEATGIPVEFTTGKDPELRERLVVEGDNTQADVFIAADAGNLGLAAEAGVFAQTDSDVLEQAVPENLRAADGEWFALSRRLRTIVTSTERVAEDEVPTGYAGLGDPEWSGRICLRPATHPYTQSLVASLIENEGEERAEEIVAGWMANEPTFIDSDTEILEAIVAGECDITVVNSYYVGRLADEEGPQPLRLSWPTDPPGVHVNISGGGVVAGAKNPEGAQRLLEWLATDGQRSFADVNFEFPANPTVEAREELLEWGEFTPDPMSVERFGELQPAAVQLLDRAGYQ
jgi:iron(III) transport system substrate-binding protein